MPMGDACGYGTSPKPRRQDGRRQRNCMNRYSWSREAHKSFLKARLFRFFAAGESDAGRRDQYRRSVGDLHEPLSARRVMI
ncbi:protein of unknown function [Paraburkholderia dioscoreae]|uniref:Uncharacterized protein n=1 Tax=Paraburkholderia dioscoreae TaxID=2604047 RepID=A0A5Q4ZKD5_9BURK|nr:protein of unknown function [Paraburkholderia dioscoreae]